MKNPNKYLILKAKKSKHNFLYVYLKLALLQKVFMSYFVKKPVPLNDKLPVGVRPATCKNRKPTNNITRIILHKLCNLFL